MPWRCRGRPPSSSSSSSCCSSLPHGPARPPRPASTTPCRCPGQEASSPRGWSSPAPAAKSRSSGPMSRGSAWPRGKYVLPGLNTSVCFHAMRCLSDLRLLCGWGWGVGRVANGDAHWSVLLSCQFDLRLKLSAWRCDIYTTSGLKIWSTY